MSRERALADAVAAHVRPGSLVHFAFTHNRAHAAANEVARQHAGTRSLRLAATGVLDYAVPLIGLDALSGGESAFAGSSYPTPGPGEPFRAFADRGDPHWSNLTMTLRLLAGALGIPAIPVPSLRGTDLATGAGRAVVANPFGDGDLLLAAAVRPDVAFLHAPVAASDGTALLEGPFGEELWGVWAAERVVVTAERVVAPAELAALAPLGRGVPGLVVDAVVEVPYGAHPQAQYAWRQPAGVRGYVEDYAFRSELRAAARDRDRLSAWLRRWVLEADARRYVELLGADRLEELHARAQRTAAPGDPPHAEPAASEPSPQERAAAIAARLAADGVRDGRYRALFAGIGLSHLAAWAAAGRARGEGLPCELVAETGMYGFTPGAGDPYVFNVDCSATSLVHDGFLRMLGGVVGARRRPVLALLAAAQVDRNGAINSSMGSDGRFLVGSGGANDVGAGAADVLVVMAPVGARRLVERVGFVTTAPSRLVGVVTEHGVLEPGVDGELELAAVVAAADGMTADAVARARAACGWPLRVGPSLRRLDEPAPAELRALRTFDPERRFLA